jgi:ABC-type Zn uptake system ZnuABC Zn-binding protein ZnuA
VPRAAFAKIEIVASVNDLGSIAAAVGGNQVEVSAIARPNADPHRVEVLPSYMVRVSRADLYLKVGLGLDSWADPIIDGSHNAEVVVLDCSAGLEPLEKPAGRVDASAGDVHPGGNPHYWLDPENGAAVARRIADALGALDPARATEFEVRASEFAQKCSRARERARAGMETASSATNPAPASGGTIADTSILTYHRSWVYLANALGIEVVRTVEPFPGIPPTADHLRDLVASIQARRIPLLLQEPYFSTEAGEFLARETGIRVITISPSCPGVDPESYLDHFERLSALLTNLH